MKAVVNEDSSADVSALKHEIRLLKVESLFKYLLCNVEVGVNLKTDGKDWWNF